MNHGGGKQEGRGKNQKQFISVIFWQGQSDKLLLYEFYAQTAASCSSSVPADQTPPPNKTASDIEITFVV